MAVQSASAAHTQGLRLISLKKVCLDNWINGVIGPTASAADAFLSILASRGDITLKAFLIAA